MKPALLFSCAAVLAAIAYATPADAADRCRARVKRTTGAIEINAANVGANPRWGDSETTITATFADEGTCVRDGRLKNCHLGAPGTLAEKTPPINCTLCVDDDGPGPPCCVTHIRNCTPGLRFADASFPPGDPRAAGSVPCATTVGNDVFFEGCNVHVRNGAGTTNTTNGLGNLIIGYNEAGAVPPTRTGSHNLVVGEAHGYSSYAGVV
ncbi:MAG: hypothetical protein MJE66_15035, partial [Proteobacteria bacterium]|nr:hypothetical protein [Pseudomonadota bacterium]